MSCQTPELNLYTSPKLYVYSRPHLSSKLFFLAPKLKKNLFIYFCLCQVVVAALPCEGFSLVGALSVGSGEHAVCGMWAL